ncbi:MAG TPA: hypothetical protein VK714_10160 [Myxococcota bacterium]|nr:hypothetical protein [Myxococcota bacterium]
MNDAEALGLRELWAAVDRLAAQNAELARRMARIERRATTSADPVSAGQAARAIGKSPDTVRRMIASGALQGGSILLKGRKRRVWFVNMLSLRAWQDAMK